MQVSKQRRPLTATAGGLLVVLLMLVATLHGEQVNMDTPSHNSNIQSPETIAGYTDLDDSDVDRLSTVVIIDYDNPSLTDFFGPYEAPDISLYNYQWHQGTQIDPLPSPGDWAAFVWIDYSSNPPAASDTHTGTVSGPGGPA